MEIRQVGLSKQKVYEVLTKHINRDPDLLLMLDNPRLERLVDVLCVAVTDVMEQNNRLVMGLLNEIAASARASQRPL